MLRFVIVGKKSIDFYYRKKTLLIFNNSKNTECFIIKCRRCLY